MKTLSMYYLMLARFVKRYNLIIFVLIVFAGLVIIILSLANIITESVIISPQSGTPSSSNASQLDIPTIEEINILDSPNSAPNPAAPSGRINPFGE